MSHTPEPWTIHGGFVIQDADGNKDIAKCFMGRTGELNERANTARIVACVNACKGINPEAVPDLLAALSDAQQALAHAISRLREDGVFSTSIALKGAEEKAWTALNKATCVQP